MKKKLQNSLTTTEQSKQLLELGVPAWTADCFYEYSIDNLFQKWSYKCFMGESEAIRNNLFSFRNGYTIPCWSVGRLMEIFAICFDPDFIHFATYVDGINFLQQIIDKFEIYTENMDFSKLEE